MFFFSLHKGNSYFHSLQLFYYTQPMIHHSLLVIYFTACIPIPQLVGNYFLCFSAVSLEEIYGKNSAFPPLSNDVSVQHPLYPKPAKLNKQPTTCTSARQTTILFCLSTLICLHSHPESSDCFPLLCCSSSDNCYCFPAIIMHQVRHIVI